MISPSTATDAPSSFTASPLGAKSHTAALNAVRDLHAADVPVADCYLERSLRERHDARVRVRDGYTDPIRFRRSRLVDAGFGLRAWTGSSHTLLWCDGLDAASIRRAADGLRFKLSRGHSGERVEPLEASARASVVEVTHDAWGDFLVERLVDAVLSAEALVSDVRVQQIRHQRRSAVYVAGSRPTYGESVVDAIRLDLTLTTQRGVFHGSATSPTPLQDPEAFALEAVEHAREQLEARPAPSRPVWLLLGPHAAARWLHEVIGHALEADVAEAGHAGLHRELQVGSEWLRVVDDATRTGAPGAYVYDDEGVAARRTMLIDGGVVRATLLDRAHAARTGAASTGNGRRASHRELPLPRMSNLIMDGGVESMDSLRAAMDDGVVVQRFRAASLTHGGEQVRLVADRARRVCRGRIGEPVQPFVLSATPLTMVRAIDAAARSEETVLLPGICQKHNQRLATGASAPPILLRPLEIRAAP